MPKINLDFQKTVKLKSGKKVVLRYPNRGDVKAMLKFINNLVEEDVYVSLNEKQSYKKEFDLVVKIIKKIQKREHVWIGVFDGNKYLGAADVEKGELRHTHIGRFNIALSKEVRGQGLGKILSNEAIRQAKEILGLKILKLSCFAVNDVALSLYKVLGFKKYGRLPDSYQYKDKLIDEILMYKEL